MNAEQLSDENDASTTRLSYKFQRLRERIRGAIDSGEIRGKLPGERLLARRFKVNAKTLSKALTDLAAEGVLERSIGLGTFVRGATQAKPGHRCLVLHDQGDSFGGVAEMLACDDIEVHRHDRLLELPPSLLAPHKSVIVLTGAVSDMTLRDLVVRGKAVVTVERRAKPFVTHAVLVDRAGGLVELGRAMLRGGHRAMMIVDDHHPDAAADARAALGAGGRDVRVGGLSDVAAAVDAGVTGLLCTRSETARRAIELCRAAGRPVPSRVSVAAVGRRDAEPPCTGRFVAAESIVSAVHTVLRDGTTHRPITLWLDGDYVDRGTIATCE
ncbi:MAG TPA: GntR family transcriptional regulator [Tepidisphaeraceae bacterium]|jgi:hypothetical protein